MRKFTEYTTVILLLHPFVSCIQSSEETNQKCIITMKLNTYTYKCINLRLFQISLGFTFPFLAGQYCYQRALALTEAAVVNILVGICPYFSAIQLPFKDQVISQLYLIFCGLLSFQSASSSVFTLLLSGVFPSEPSDRITVSKVFAVLFNFCGVVLVR